MKKLLSILLLAILVVACGNNAEKLAYKNIDDYMLNIISDDDVPVTLISANYSKLYIIYPKHSDRIPKPTKPEDTGDFAGDFGNMLELYGTGISLAASGCTYKTFDQIVKNDKKFNEWKTDGEEFVVLGKFELKDKWLNTHEVGLCFRLDSMLNIYKPYPIEADLDRIWGLTEK
ncbi:MAG: hypothetical protein R3Y38_07875 [Rikenellaceae bacterium]